VVYRHLPHQIRAISLYPHHTLPELIFHFKHSLAYLLLLITIRNLSRPLISLPLHPSPLVSFSSHTPPPIPHSETIMKALNSTSPRACRRGRTGTLTASTAPLWTTSRGKTSCREALRGTHVHAKHLYLYPAFASLLCSSIISLATLLQIAAHTAHQRSASLNNSPTLSIVEICHLHHHHHHLLLALYAYYEFAFNANRRDLRVQQYHLSLAF
jgi:hypothetical protein